MRRTPLVLVLAALPLLAGQPLAYLDGAVRLSGYVARPEAVKGTVPGVLIIHQWMGLTGHERMEADRMARESSFCQRGAAATERDSGCSRRQTSRLSRPQRPP